MHDELRKQIPGIAFNGDVLGNSLYTVLNCQFSKNRKIRNDSFNLDINNICKWAVLVPVGPIRVVM
jgi:hypothetical protein